MVDRATVAGLLLSVTLLAAVMIAGAGFSAHAFWQTSSLALVLGGTALTTVVSLPAGRLRTVRAMLANAFFVRTRPLEEVVITLVALAEVARRQGLLALDRPVGGLRDGFLKRAMQMAIDGYDPAVIRMVMQTELESVELRHREGRGVLESMGRTAPTFGMIGTLIGLVIMLGRMDDPSKIGPGMAVALLTTLYGLVVANVFCFPLARKLSQRSNEELLCKTVAIEGVLAIQAGDHPRVLAHKLQAYLAPDRRGVQIPRPVTDRGMPAMSPKDAATVPPAAESSASMARSPVRSPISPPTGAPTAASPRKGPREVGKKLVEAA
jgi:chemotaxis protein MotA